MYLAASTRSQVATTQHGDHGFPTCRIVCPDIRDVVGFLGYPQPGGGAHPPNPSEGVLGEVLGDWANLALRQAHKNT